MWFIGVEVEQETSAPPPKKNPGSAPVFINEISILRRIRDVTVHNLFRTISSYNGIRNFSKIDFLKFLIFRTKSRFPWISLF